MMNALEGLLWKRKNSIMNSIFQNTLYNGQKLCDFFNEKPKTRKKGEDFWDLFWILRDALPQYDFPDFIEKRAIFEKYPHLYVAKYYHLFNIKELLDYFDARAGQQETAVDYMPHTLLRPYRIFIYDKNTKTQRMESVWRGADALSHPFVKLVHKDWREILESLDWSDYQSLTDDLKNEKRRKKAAAV